MKYKLLVLNLTVWANALFSQEFAGYRSGNYIGVNGVFFNPASISDSRYRFDINLFAAGSSVANNQASFNLHSIFQTGNQQDLKNKFLSTQAGLSSGLLNFDIHGPSVMFNLGNTATVAVTSRIRSVGNITNIDGKLVQTVSDSLNNAQLPYTISSGSNMKINVNAWSEYGLSFSKVLAYHGNNFFKAGISLKYLVGIADGYVNINSLHTSINYDLVRNDAYLSNSTGYIESGFGGANISNLTGSDFTKKQGSGLGIDLGFIYEYRPDYLAGKEGEKNSLPEHLNKYKFKIGLSVLDIGKISYAKDMQRSGGYNININNNNRLYSSDISNVSINDYNSFFLSKPQFFTPSNTNNAASFKASLPATLHLNIDYHLQNGFYVSLESQFPLSRNDQTAFNSMYYTSVSLTPRYEGRALGFYLPLNTNRISGFNAGVAFRFGPLFLGSGTILNALFGNSKQADAFIGLHFGGLRHKKSKEAPKEHT